VCNLSALYNYFDNSAVRTSGLADIHTELGMTEYRLKEAKFTRWLSLHQSVQAVYRSLKPILIYLSEVDNDAIGAGLYKLLRDPVFVQVLCLFMDVFPHLTKLSKTFQQADIDVASVEPLVSTVMEEVEWLRENHGEYLTKFRDLVADLAKDDRTKLAIKETANSQFSSIRGQFLVSVRDRLTARFPSMPILSSFAAVFDPALSAKSDPELRAHGESALETLTVHYCSMGSARKTEDDSDSAAADAKVEHAVEKFAIIDRVDYNSGLPLLAEYNALKSSWVRQYANGKKQGMRMKDLILAFLSDAKAWVDHPRMAALAAIALTLPVATAECERIFRTQNRIKTDARSRLTQEKLCNLMKISMEGPALDANSFDFDSIVNEWTKAKRRRAVIGPAKTQKKDDAMVIG